MSDWLDAGQDYELFWRLTPREIYRILRGHYNDRRVRHDEARARNHELAQWVAFAFHDPKKMPKFEVTKSEEETEQARLVDELKVRGFLISLAMRSEGG